MWIRTGREIISGLHLPQVEGGPEKAGVGIQIRFSRRKSVAFSTGLG